MFQKLEFLSPYQTPKTVRTTLYGDQHFSLWELEIVHTPVFQRLYDLKQLGFADRVFPDAVHSRLNHVLGVAQRAEQMAKNLVRWLEEPIRASQSFEYALESENGKICTITAQDLAIRVREHIPAIRLIGLLHDLTHAAFGHTLEDEVRVFDEKHDDPIRQARFFDTLVSQLISIWSAELGLRHATDSLLESLRRLQADPSGTKERTREIREALGKDPSQQLAVTLRDLELACIAMLHINYLHRDTKQPPTTALLVSEVSQELDPERDPVDFCIHRDAIFVDIVGNTICADLIDYAERDSRNAGLRVQFDDRLLRYVAAVSVKDGLSPSTRPCIRL